MAVALHLLQDITLHFVGPRFCGQIQMDGWDVGYTGILRRLFCTRFTGGRMADPDGRKPGPILISLLDK